MEGNNLIEGGCKKGMLIDYGELSAIVKPIVEKYLDHHYLNGTTGLENPTSEELAYWLYHRLKPMLSILVAVVIEETCTSKCEYRP